LEGRIRDSAKSLLAQLEAELPPEEYIALLEQGRELDLENVVNDLIGARRNLPSEFDPKPCWQRDNWNGE
jgi:hypothetical protein